MRDSPLNEGREEWGLVLSSHVRKGGNCKRMNGAGKGKTCKLSKVYFLLLIFTEKKSEGHLKV